MSISRTEGKTMARSTPGMTATAVKRLVGDTLYLAEHDGASWATNRYWLAPSSAVAPLLDKFNVQVDAYGTYECNGSVRKQSDDTMSSAMLGKMLGLADYSRPLTRVHVAGEHDAYIRVRGDWLALFADSDGAHVAVRCDWLDWLSEVNVPREYGTEYSNVRIVAAADPVPSVAVVADKVLVHDGYYGDVDGSRTWIERTTEQAGSVLLGVVMSFRVNG